MSKPKNSKL